MNRWVCRRNEEGVPQLSFVDENHNTTIVLSERKDLENLIEEVKAFFIMDDEKSENQSLTTKEE